MDYRDRWELKEYLLQQRLGRRIGLLHAGMLLLLVSYLLAFWYLQGVRGDEYKLLAETNRLREVALPPTRGVITDRLGEVIASTRPALRLVLRREGLEDREEQLRRLEGILSVPYETLLQRLERMRGRPAFEPAVLEEDLELGELAPIEARRERFPAVEVQQAALRTYPAGEVTSHVLGYVGEVSEAELTNGLASEGLDRGDIVGKAGVERRYDRHLRGRRGWKLVTVNNTGRQIGEGRTRVPPEDGSDLRLTLDLRLQRALVEAFGDESGAGVFMDPRTGDVLALVSAPTFDPNLFASGITPEAWESILQDPRRPLHDRAIASFYAPGSVFKVIMATAALETGTITPSTRFECRGSATVYGNRFLCWKRGGHGTVDLHRALVHSCNVYFYQVGKLLSIGTIHRYGSMFNLGRRTGIDLPGESAGVLPSEEWKLEVHGQPWYPGETISVAIGQGMLAVTPVQMATMISTVATGGKLRTPHLARDPEPDGREIAVSPKTFDVIRDALVEVVQKGTGRRASLRSVRIAGKTGTAQVFKHSAGIDADELPKQERDHAWFVGYAPAGDPEIAFAVVVEHGGHGGTTAAPIARKVLETFFTQQVRLEPPDEVQRAAGGLARGEGVRTAAAR